MVTKLHRHMGALIRENVITSLPNNKSIHISPFWYSIGNMLPDISWLPLTHPHFEAQSKPYMSNMLDTALRKHRRQKADALYVSPIFSLRLGIVSHYLCDFFCVAHQGAGINGAKWHLNYEHQMRDFFYDHRSEIEALCRFEPTHMSFSKNASTADVLLEEFRRWHDSYSATQSDFIRDFQEFRNSSEDRVEAFMTDIRTAIGCCTNLLYAFAVAEK